MVVSTGRVDREELVISRITLIQKSSEIVEVKGKYKRLFHGKTSIPYGKYTVRCPVEDKFMGKLVTSLVREYKQFSMDVGVSGVEVV